MPITNPSIPERAHLVGRMRDRIVWNPSFLCWQMGHWCCGYSLAACGVGQFVDLFLIAASLRMEPGLTNQHTRDRGRHKSGQGAPIKARTDKSAKSPIRSGAMPPMPPN